MKPWTFCDRCRGLEVGWNRKYLGHRLKCTGGLRRCARLATAIAATAAVVMLFPTTYNVSPSATEASGAREADAVEQAPVAVVSIPPDPAVLAIEDLLAEHTQVTSPQRLRIARAVIRSAREHDVDPFLVTGILIAESSGNAYAISSQEAVGIMQIHLPTWRSLVEAEGLNLFLIEDNVDLGTRILGEYTRRYGLSDGILRYLGASEPTEAALTYLARVEDIYTDRQAD